MEVQEIIQFYQNHCTMESASCQLKCQMYQEKVKVEPDFCKAKDSRNLLRDAVENQSYAWKRKW